MPFMLSTVIFRVLIRIGNHLLVLYNGFDSPDAVKKAAPGNTVAHGWSPIASHYLEIELQPGEQKDLVFMLGYVEVDKDDKWESKAVINKTARQGNDLKI